MKITLPKQAKQMPSCDLLVITTFKPKSEESAAKTKRQTPVTKFEVAKHIKDLDKELGGHLLPSAQAEGFSGKEGQSFVTATMGMSHANSIALLGLGDAQEQSIDLYRRSGGEAFKLAQRKRAKKVVYVIPEHNRVPLFDVVQAVSEGLLLASYQMGRYQTKDKPENHVQEVEILLHDEPSKEHKSALMRGQIIAESVILARDLINEGPSELNPVRFAKIAEQNAQEAGLDIKILDEKQLKKERMALLLAVAEAAQVKAPPRLICLKYKPKVASKRTIVLIGKGVTFDSGGLDIKPADGMLDMKIDMSGAAAVLGAMRAIAKLNASINVIGYLGCVENGIGPHAYHPGDVLISRKGTSVEIANTDAEGRLVLADIMTYSQDNDKPDIIIDIATLTGACVVALGAKTAGIFSNDDALCQSLCSSGKNSGESFWRLPILQELKEVIKSPNADIKNCGDRYGGSITAALFLEEFIEKTVKWAHLDIAGPASTNKPHAYNTTGGVGFGVRTLVDYIMGQK